MRGSQSFARMGRRLSHDRCISPVPLVLTRQSRTMDIDSAAKSRRSPMWRDPVVAVVWMAAIPLGTMAAMRVRFAAVQPSGD